MCTYDSMILCGKPLYPAATLNAETRSFYHIES